MGGDRGGDYDIFVSFAHADVKGTAGLFFDELLTIIRAERARFNPDPLRVFLDHSAIRSMADWKHRILAGLREARVLLAVIGPGYFASSWCRREWDAWTQHEQDRGDPDSAAPLYAITVRRLERESDAVTEPAPGPERSSRSPVDALVIDIA